MSKRGTQKRYAVYEQRHSKRELEEYEEELKEEEEEKKVPEKWFVLDTNVIISCVNIIPGDDDNWIPPLDFSPDISNANLIIPGTVFNELNKFKEEHSLRGVIARTASERLMKIFSNSGRTIDEIRQLRAPIKTGWNTQTITILPISRNSYRKILPYAPSDDDNDGWIAVTTLAAELLLESEKNFLDTTDNLTAKVLKRKSSEKTVTLLTNDHNLQTKADLYGVNSSSFVFRKREPFNGCRELTVPSTLFAHFYQDEFLTEDEFNEALPNELPLADNEFVIMEPEDDDYPASYYECESDFPNIGRFDKNDRRIYPLRSIKKEGAIPLNDGIACFYEALNDVSIHVIVVTGEAGTGKTYTSIIHAIKDVAAGNHSRIIVIPTLSAKNPLGAIPGSEKQKLEPLIAPYKDAIRSWLSQKPEFKKLRAKINKYGAEEEKTEATTARKSQPKGSSLTYGNFTGNFTDLDYENNDYRPEDFGIEHSKKRDKRKREKTDEQKSDAIGRLKDNYNYRLSSEVDRIWDRYFEAIPHEEAQSHSFDDAIVILDEFQRSSIDEARTLVTRPGRNSKLIIMGDVGQIRDSSPEKRMRNGLVFARMTLMGWHGAANINLTETIRSDIVRVVNMNSRSVLQYMGLLQ